MYPSILANNISQALREFIITGYETTSWPFEGKFRALVEEDGEGEAFIKGPYVSVQLPFVKTATASRHFFSSFTTKHAPYAHQEQAWQRLTAAQPQSTLIATGTGSGKTECFMFPVLHHALTQHPQRGIKTIVIYPMNALATDQAKRFAETIAQTPEMKGKIRVGLFVGDSDGTDQKVMGDDSVITCKHTMRKDPPDILLTNYKMLDFLLMRPKDQPLWQYNQADTLRYLVVDELHTFDGAQGSDLAMLIRRLKAHLNTPKDHLVTVGTSATLGSENQKQGLADYACQIFDAKFDVHALIGETRQSHSDFVEPASFTLLSFDATADALLPTAYDNEADYLKAQVAIFFGADELAFELESMEAKQTLGDLLKQHILFHNLLLKASQKPTSWQNLLPDSRLLPPNLKTNPSAVLLSLLSLIAVARGREYPGAPFVSLRLQLWARELRRVVASVGDDSPNYPVHLHYSDDLKQGAEHIHLPVVQCSECHSTAWLSAKQDGDTHIQEDLRTIYEHFFANDKNTLVLFPLQPDQEPPVGDGLEKHLCADCGHLQTAKGVCGACQSENTIRVYEPNLLKSKRTSAEDAKEHGSHRLESERRCPVCQANNSLVLFGSRAASLTSIAIHQLFASHYNQDKKLIAFSDSVQDAAHRAGFYAARTWEHNVRSAMAQALLGQAKLAYLDFTNDWLSLFLSQQDPQMWNEQRVIHEFIAPNLQAKNDFIAFQQGKLSDSSWLLSQIKQRLTWEAIQEFGIKAQVGRSMPHIGLACVGWDVSHVDNAIVPLIEQSYNTLGKSLTHTQAQQLLWGISLRLLHQGAIAHPTLEGFINKGGDYYVMGNKVRAHMPELGRQSPLPRFLSTHREKSFEVIKPTNEQGWYIRWAKQVVGLEQLTEREFFNKLLLLSLSVLEHSGLLISFTSEKNNPVWAINPQVCWITTQVECLYLEELHGCGNQCTHQHEFGQWMIPSDWIEALTGLPSLSVSRSKQGKQATYQPKAQKNPNYYRRFFTESDIHRVVAHEHTALLEREARESLEKRFKAKEADREVWWENLLSATPTMEMGIDIGDLSAVVMASVPPTQASYLQRMGRAGRSTGNALVLTLANGQPHDLYFYQDPLEMMAGEVQAPAIFLGASMVLKRQCLAFCFDRWGKVQQGKQDIPSKLQTVLDAVSKHTLTSFPYTLIQFIREQRDELWEAFDAILPSDVRVLSDDSRERVKAFLMGTVSDDDQSVEWLILNQLEYYVQERERLDDQIKRLEKAKAKAEKLPQDQATQELIAELTQEIAGNKQLKYQINQRDTLNFFTDEGLLPNYAFPEEGATLQSVIYRHVKSTTHEGKEVESISYEYVRPASSALSELAPNSVFYASNKHVTISRIDVPSGDNLETLQLCPSCHHTQRIGIEAEHSHCPKCGDPRWADAAQRRKVVKLRKVYAYTRYEDALIGDDSDTRTPLFFNKQMLISFDSDSVDLAYALKTDTKPFGFEFIKKASFLEINFGESSSDDSVIFKVAGKELNRPGFKVCKDCGMVQPKRGKAKHLHQCQYKHSQDGEGIIDCLYLYREYTSEAIRVLMPMMSIADPEEQLHSFVAALQLGLKKRFGGKVDHLQIAKSDEPIPGSEQRAHYIVIYDSVPGGTGYLNELLANPDNLMQVFKQAQQVMANCACQHRVPEVDGCYQCLYAYRNAQGMEKTSRKTALAMLGEILDPSLVLEPVKRLGSMKKHQWEDSLLEERFPEALKKLSGSNKLNCMSIRCHSDLIAGKKGYLLEVAGQQYTLEMHARLASEHGALYACEPDFLIRPVKTSAQIKPIAIFLDGYTFHHDKLHEDLLKRQGLFLTGQYHVWSLTWHDVESAFAGNEVKVPNVMSEANAPDFNSFIAKLTANIAIQDHAQLVKLNPLEALVRFLAEPNASDWKHAMQLRLLSLVSAKHAQDASYKQSVVNRAKSTLPQALSQEATDQLEVPFIAETIHYANEDNLLTLTLVADDRLIKNFPDGEILVWLEAELTSQPSQHSQAVWQKTLQLLNWFQFIPLFYAGTQTGTQQGHYGQLNWGLTQPGSIKPNEWDVVYQLADEAVHEILDKLSNNNIQPPVVAYELTQHGRIVAEAELAWEEMKVVYLMAYQVDESRMAFEDQGWQVFTEHTPEELWLKSLGVKHE